MAARLYDHITSIRCEYYTSQPFSYIVDGPYQAVAIDRVPGENAIDDCS
ncbi:hypothetical protein [Sodalis-like endosymbiont of Proechinophthirus fluctus]